MQICSKILGQIHASFRIFIFIWILILPGFAFSQFYFYDDPEANLDVKFLKERMDINKEESFFNVLKIKNNANQRVTFNINLNIPQGWTLMTEKSRQIVLNPLDSTFIPIRAAAAKDVKGEIGYSIVASITDNKEKAITNAYSYVTVPKISALTFRVPTRVLYFDPTNNRAQVEVKISNEGNVDELVYFNLTSSEFIEIDGEIRNLLLSDYIIPYNVDTTLFFDVKLKDSYNVESTMTHRVNINVTTQDTSFRAWAWIKNLNSEFENYISDQKRMLIVDAKVQNLFSPTDPYLNYNLRGNLLLKKSRRISYEYIKLNSQSDNILLRNRSSIEFSNPHATIKVGDIIEANEMSMAGEGASARLRYKRNQLKLIASKNINSDILNLGSNLNFSIGNLPGIRLGYSHSINNGDDRVSQLGLIGFGLKPIKGHSLNFLVAGSMINNNQDTIYTEEGYRMGINYGSKIGDLTIRSNTDFGSRRYAGSFNGRIESRSFLEYPISPRLFLRASYFKRFYGPAKYSNHRLLPQEYSDTDFLNLRLNFSVSRQVGYVFGIDANSQATNSIVTLNRDVFRSMSTVFLGGINLRTLDNQTIYTSLSAGYTWFVEHPNTLGEQAVVERNASDPPLFTARYSLSYSAKIWGAYFNFEYGPSYINQHFSYFYFNDFPLTLRVYPYFEKFLYKDIIKFSSRLNYINNINRKSNRYNLNNFIDFYFGKGWEMRFLNTISYHKTIDNITEQPNVFTSTYYELGLKKRFNFKQPRLKYYNFKMVFYKDLNGDRKRDGNEPGVRNVLVNISRNEEFDQFAEDRFEYSGEYTASELLTGQEGEIYYENIPEGKYFVNFNSLSRDLGNFSPEYNSVEYYINADKTIYIPYIERNKIFGKVILNRSKLSNLGKIDVSNIKITATDLEGRQYSSLTDKEGKFVIFVPNVNKYIVTINNIFFENFELQQNNFEIQLNGYKQFEITFIFNEKRRRIRFNTEYEFDQNLDLPGIEIVRRTTMSGIVKDATTQKPIKANVQIIDGNGDVVTESNTRVIDGKFSLSYMAGDDYSLVVTADDYWFYEEKLRGEQVVTFQNINKEILLKNITVGAIIPMQHLYFDPGSADLRAEAVTELQRLLEVLKNNPDVRIATYGHTDDVEILETDEDLALERAKMVANFLIANGYIKVKYSGFANTRPTATNDTEDGRQLNRRVEIVVTEK